MMKNAALDHKVENRPKLLLGTNSLLKTLPVMPQHLASVVPYRIACASVGRRSLSSSCIMLAGSTLRPTPDGDSLIVNTGFDASKAICRYVNVGTGFIITGGDALRCLGLVSFKGNRRLA